ncbi:hypothetical protein FRZ67_20345 [Panacibacter ginsenosidivorans]|uniref:Uncharacterized protein n=1 Tax=Panacibacter ginsenosidivorans TaxID=1813871 RepID=A0A5B8VG38_9BACT|nr:hypothetical protein [Panacibacter ginsenosidivorans]QEC69536.1 hypothetical protein FRZ67_20345 [Panacibacter ginsenosidivorans]
MIIVFIAGQLFINYKRGVVFSPFYHYGMYSSVIKPEAHYNIPEVFVDGERLAAKDFSPQEWDNIMQPVIQFRFQQGWNNAIYQNEIQRFLPFADATKFNNSITKEEFDQWYQLHLQNLLDKKINKVEVIISDYNFIDDTFQKANN